MRKYDVCIIGGGAAGLISAASLCHGVKTVIIEKNKILGRKVMATGGGRCNITNRSCRDKDMTLDFFKSMGLECYSDEEGRYYPYSNQASDVVKILTDCIEAGDIDIFTEAEADSISHAKGSASSFKVKMKDGRSLAADRVILATGGKAAPQFGTTGDGYGFAKALGHTVNKVYPILTGIDCGSLKDIKGVRAKGTVSLLKDGAPLAHETGEIQFTEDGISGICVMNLTPLIRSEKGESISDALRRYEISLDLAPDFTEEEMAARKSSFGILSEKLAARVDIKDIKDWRLPVLGVKGWKNAQCTGGGVSVDEIDMETMESKLVPGLYLTGELIDVQGPCGGYNLQNAWETGMKAAADINRKLKTVE